MSSIDFSLPALNSSFQLDVSGAILREAPDTMTDVSATAIYNFKTSHMNNIFKYFSDSYDVNDITDGTDVRYYVFMDQWPVDASLNPAHAEMKSASGHMLPTDGTNVVRNKNLVKHDFTRYLAYKLFNTVYGVDLFSNETALHEDISSKGRTAKNSIMTVLKNVSAKAATGSTIVVGQTDASDNRYSTNANTATSNICRELMRQIASVAPARFYDASYNDASGNPYRTVPLRAGDTINFKVFVKAADNQHTLTGRSAAFEERVYKIQLVLSDTANTTPVDGTATDLLDYVANA